MQRQRNQGLVAETLFVGMTRPPMVWGVTYTALMLNLLLTVETFIITKNLLWLLAGLPIHGICYLLCLYEPRFFDLMALWLRTRLFGFVTGSLAHWKANSYTALPVDLPDARGRRRAAPAAVVV